MNKYMVLKLAELRRFLTVEEQEQFASLMGLMAERKSASNTPTPEYFVLNMTDKYAVPAVEKYREEIQLDIPNRSSAGVEAAYQAAWKAREWALTHTDGSKVPT